MNVGVALEGLDQPRVLGQVGEEAQLDLRVVGHQQLAALGGDEGPPELPAPRRPQGDVLEVG